MASSFILNKSGGGSRLNGGDLLNAAPVGGDTFSRSIPTSVAISALSVGVIPATVSVQTTEVRSISTTVAIEFPLASPTFVGEAHGGHNTTDTWPTTLPSGVQAGDLLVLILSFTQSADSASTPSGWTALTGSPLNNSAASGRSVGFYKLAGASETAPTVSCSGTPVGAWAMSAWRGVDQTTPIEAQATIVTLDTDTSHVSSNITTLGAARRLVIVTGHDEDVTHSPYFTEPSGFTEHLDYQEASGFVCVGIFSKVEASAGTYSYTYTTVDPDGAAGWVLALKGVASASSSRTVTATAAIQTTEVRAVTTTAAAQTTESRAVTATIAIIVPRGVPTTAVITIPQVARPSADVADGSWTNESGSAVNMHASIDEAIVNHSDYIQSSQSPASNDVYEVQLSSVNDPNTANNHTVYYYLSTDVTSGDTINVTVSLVQGTTIISTDPSAPRATPNTPTLYLWTLSDTEADAITDYADLRLRFTAVKGA